MLAAVGAFQSKAHSLGARELVSMERDATDCKVANVEARTREMRRAVSWIRRGRGRRVIILSAAA